MSKNKQEWLPFRVEVHEGRWTGVIGRLSSQFDAQAIALRHVDEALPRNTIHVYEERANGTERHLGWAAFGCDGEAYWMTAK